jgi:CheY-like chemotaxis protein
VESARELGLNVYLVKPVRRAELFEAIARAMENQPSPSYSNGKAAAIIPSAVQPPWRILLVEDSPDNRLVIRAYLKHQPHLIDEADDGEIGVCKFSQGAYDIVLMDLQMPVVDGFEAMRADPRLRARARRFAHPDHRAHCLRSRRGCPPLYRSRGGHARRQAGPQSGIA